MYYDVTLINNIGESAGNLHRHPIQSVDEEGAETLFPASANLLASCDDVSPMEAIGCSGLNSAIRIGSSISEVTIYPNPNGTQNAYFSVNLEKALDLSIKLYNITGEYIGDLGTYGISSGNSKIELQLPKELSSGTYLIGISSEKDVFFSKFIKL